MKSYIAIIAFLCTMSVSCIAQGTKIDTTVVVQDKAKLIESWKTRQKSIEEEYKVLSIQIQFAQSLADTTLRFKASTR